ncbi:MAG: hypothetical protein L0228_13240 [Planctomycetes bacterium]|nr:hypothetical protein [Planctomycetota bacterium]
MASNAASSQAPRYSDAASVENHPQITDFVPRRYRTIVMLLVMGLATTATLGALHHFAPTVAAFAGLPTLRPFDLSAAGSLAAWISAVVLFLASITCLLLYSIRRHRIDDFRGRYRIWLGASVACFVLSANSVAGLHHVLACSLSHFAGWTALRDGAAWWLAFAGLPIAWIGVRVLLDVTECRLAAFLVFAAATCYAAATASYLGFVPATALLNASLITGVTIFLGNWFTFAAVVSYARYVVLDAQGLVTSRRPVVKKSREKSSEKAKPASEPKPAATQPTLLSVANYARKASQSDADADSKKWIDGSRPERESYDDDDDDDSSGSTRLSKADRKRLRKLKAQNRAA